MAYSFYLGIDVSKLTFDFCLLDHQAQCIVEGQAQNSETAIHHCLLALQEEFLGEDSTLVCLEHAGYYAAPILRSLIDFAQLDIWMESALQIKRSSGLQRGKNDRIDALRIANYSFDFQRKARLWQPPTQSIERLGLLLSHRDRLVRNWLSLSNTLTEEKDFIPQFLHQELEKINRPAIQAIEQAIAEIESKIDHLLEMDTDLKRQAQIVKSVPGFGTVIASKILQITQGFTRLTNPRAMACFAGVAPFEHSSGTSLKGKTRISHLANKDLKKMLHLAALVTIRKGNIMHDYFQRKVAEGKPKMAVINAIRNKLIHILYACIRNNTMYQKNYHHSLA